MREEVGAVKKQVPAWLAVLVIVAVLAIVVGFYALAGRRAQPFEPTQPIHGKVKGFTPPSP